MNDIKRRLREYKFKKAEKTELELRLTELRVNIGPAGLSYEEKGGPTYKISSSTENEAIKIAELEEKLSGVIHKNGLEIARMENALNMLTEKERQAIELKYIEDYDINTVCYKLDRSYAAVQRYLRNGMGKVEKLLKN